MAAVYQRSRWTVHSTQRTLMAAASRQSHSMALIILLILSHLRMVLSGSSRSPQTATMGVLTTWPQRLWRPRHYEVDQAEDHSSSSHCLSLRCFLQQWHRLPVYSHGLPPIPTGARQKDWRNRYQRDGSTCKDSATRVSKIRSSRMRIFWKDCFFPQMLPWNRPIYIQIWPANAGEGRESNWAANIQHLISNAQAQISTREIHNIDC